MARPPERAVPRVGLALVLVTLAASLLLGALLRAPCADLGDAGDPALRVRLCYTDITALWHDRALGDRFPYVQAGNEYPVGTGLLMGLTALPVSDDSAYLLVNEVVLSLAALAVALLLYRSVGTRALYFSAAPALVVYGFLNWDLFAIALSVGAVTALLAGRDRLSGALAGLGAAAKVFPALLLPGFVLERERAGERRGAGRVAIWAALAWIVINVPFIALRPTRWSQFFRFNSTRAVDPATLWGLGCTERVSGVCLAPGPVNLASLLLFAGGAAVVWTLRSRREPGFPRWTFGFALMVLFLLTNKVYSPQYSLWLVPWFALCLPDLRRFLVWSAIDVAAWAATLAYVRQVPGFEGPPFLVVKALVLARAIALLWLLAGYVRRPAGDEAPSRQWQRREPASRNVEPRTERNANS